MVGPNSAQVNDQESIVTENGLVAKMEDFLIYTTRQVTRLVPIHQNAGANPTKELEA
jgi:hypothetical protein